MTRGEAAERGVEERLRAALPSGEYRLYANAGGSGPCARTAPRATARRTWSSPTSMDCSSWR